VSILLLLFALLIGVFALGTSSVATSDQSTLESTYAASVPLWAHREGFVRNPAAVKGAHLFAEAGCLSCHMYLGKGSSNLGAPDLSAEGKKGRGLRFQIAHLRCPSCASSDSPMPSFEDLGARNLRLLGLFLEASKGPA
jgi:mono/diheme cytochrome c family protein